jgi:hypothetical protein
MKPLARSPHHLVRNLHSYCFRVNVPKDLQHLVGRRELRYSLRTGAIGVARVKAQIIAAQVHRIFQCLRSGGRKMNDLTDEKIQELVQQYLKKYIEGLETRHLDDDSPIVTREDFHSYLGDLDSYKNDIIEYLGIGDYETVEKNVTLLLEENVIEGINKDSAAYVKLCRGVLRAQLQGIEIEKKQMSSGLIETLEDRFRGEPVTSIRTSNGREKGLLISEVIERFADEAKTNWRDKTKEENLAILNFFVRVVGDIPIQAVSRRTVTSKTSSRNLTNSGCPCWRCTPEQDSTNCHSCTSRTSGKPRMKHGSLTSTMREKNTLRPKPAEGSFRFILSSWRISIFFPGWKASRPKGSNGYFLSSRRAGMAMGGMSAGGSMKYTSRNAVS